MEGKEATVIPIHGKVEWSNCKTNIGAIMDLRHRILRMPGMSAETLTFDGDWKPETWHVASFLKGVWKILEQPLGMDRTPDLPICCASFMLNPLKEEPAWQLRGMATDSSYQGQGVGRSLLNWAVQSIGKSQEVGLFWCYARLSAVPFYEKSGWECISEVFDIPTVGPHRIMKKRL